MYEYPFETSLFVLLTMHDTMSTSDFVFCANVETFPFHKS